ncbi:MULTISPECIES: hypothetical protein [unclassified Moorena]|uniref:hypothetical protein n=1 Tax=unclassified Moorena TaxID=2683338 RepID=UPI0014003245|nr:MULTISPECIES: hypothetical protein [unclassified Moorena]NEO16092.1 hypothetical protein [Moorena sp. SIO3E8]NEQ00991.1 hypothetical protein [Moorena sp. SIO3F7]
MPVPQDAHSKPDAHSTHRVKVPDSRFPTPDSRHPTPHTPHPTPCSLNHCIGSGISQIWPNRE